MFKVFINRRQFAIENRLRSSIEGLLQIEGSLNVKKQRVKTFMCSHHPSNICYSQKIFQRFPIDRNSLWIRWAFHNQLTFKRSSFLAETFCSHKTSLRDSMEKRPIPILECTKIEKNQIFILHFIRIQKFDQLWQQKE